MAGILRRLCLLGSFNIILQWPKDFFADPCQWHHELAADNITQAKAVLKTMESFANKKHKTITLTQ
jgi:hypothetical protein